MGGACSGKSEGEKAAETEADNTQQHKLEQPRPTDERRRILIRIIMILRHDLRDCFGLGFADGWGFFVDCHLSRKIRSFGDWIDYPKGHCVLKGHSDRVLSAVITQDGCYLFTGAGDRSVIKWDLRTNKIVTRFRAHMNIGGNYLAHTTGILISAGWDNEIRFWNDADCSLIRILCGHTSRVTGISLNHRRGTTLVSGSDDMTCRLWSVKNGECLRVMIGHTDCVKSVIFANDVILSGSDDLSIRIWNPETGKELRKITDVISDSNIDLSLNCDSSMLVCCHYRSLTLIRYPSMEAVSTAEMNPYRCCFHPLIPTVLAISDDNDDSIQIYRTDKSEFTLTLEGHSHIIYSLHFIPDGHRLISISADKTVRVWDVSNSV